MFKVATDPPEITNLAADPAQAEKLKSLRQQMIVQRGVWDDRDPASWNGIGFGPELKNPKAPNPSGGKDF